MFDFKGFYISPRLGSPGEVLCPVSEILLGLVTQLWAAPGSCWESIPAVLVCPERGGRCPSGPSSCPMPIPEAFQLTPGSKPHFCPH